MTSSPELLRFFHTEATEYVDAIEGLVNSADAPEAGAFVAAARAMRGSATMARATRIADVAFVLEQIGNALREGDLTWSVSLQDALRAAVADLRSLVGSVGQWTDDDDQRAAHRLAELRRYAPNEPPRSTPPAPAASAAPIFIALQTAAIAADLETFVTDSRNRTLLDDVVSRVRSLRGIAGVPEHPPLGDVADTVETTLRALAPDALLSEVDIELFRAAAAVFRRASADLRSRGRINLASGEIARFARAAATPKGGGGGAGEAATAERVVRIDDLFYADGGPHLVQRGRASEATIDARFHDEAVARAEHLRRLTAEAREAADPVSRDRVTRDLRQNLERLESVARSFRARQTAAYFGDIARQDALLDAAALEGIGSGVRALLQPGMTLSAMEQHFAALHPGRRVTPTPQRPSVVASATKTASAPAGPAAKGKELHALLESGIAGLRPLENEPLSVPARLESDEIVPVETLLYRGRSALLRAIEIRDAMRTADSVDRESLLEIYDLLDLARSE